MKAALLISFAVGLTFKVSANPGFSTMEDGDRIEVSRHSTGCFHDATAYYEVRMIEGSYLFREYTITWSEDPQPRVLEKVPAGEIRLTAEDVEKLDGLMKFYRGKKEAFSTTQVSLLVEYFEQGKRVKVERLKDPSGGYGLEKREDVVTFYRLAERIERGVPAEGEVAKP